jgi:hypothetical protein
MKHLYLVSFCNYDECLHIAIFNNKAKAFRWAKEQNCNAIEEFRYLEKPGRYRMNAMWIHDSRKGRFVEEKI